ncbi:hypothetical protein HK100_008237 [Physocladia obscura]|uniref:Uncharacterized protein n=1 Tax=Physocladia obscura TaxID=109957 RepID=A0AAD5SQV3_9FUNG|nr:hypothetical protein HK100_008237 [Physocladia obscura]
MDQIFDTSAELDQKQARIVVHTHAAIRVVNMAVLLTSIGLTARKAFRFHSTPLLSTSLLRGNAIAVPLAICGSAAGVESLVKADFNFSDRLYRKIHSKNVLHQSHKWSNLSNLILNNKNQSLVDSCCIGGATAGFAVLALTSNPAGFIARVVGGAGLGSLVGFATFMASSRMNQYELQTVDRTNLH